MREFLLQRKWDIVGMGATVLLGVVLLGVNMTVFLPQKRQAACQTNLKQMGLGFMQYIRDYDEMCPPARNWSDVLDPYTKSRQIFQCPDRGNRASGYAYREWFSTMNQSVVEDTAKTIMVFDSDLPMRFAADNGESLPRTPRHPKGNNLLFADGHVQAQLKTDFTIGANTLRASFLSRQKWQKEQDAANAKRLRVRKPGTMRKSTP